jgi:hypothetical protein
MGSVRDGWTFGNFVTPQKALRDGHESDNTRLRLYAFFATFLI